MGFASMIFSKRKPDEHGVIMVPDTEFGPTPLNTVIGTAHQADSDVALAPESVLAAHDDAHVEAPVTVMGHEPLEADVDTPAAHAAPAAPAAPVANAEAGADGADEATPSSGPLSLRRAMRGGRTAAEEEDTELRLPFIGHLSLPRQLRILLGVLAGFSVLALFALWHNVSSNAVASAQTQIASDALMHSQRVGKAAPNAIQGNPEAFLELEDSRLRLNADVTLLLKGGYFDGRKIPTPPSHILQILTAAKQKWNSSDNAAGTILGRKVELANFDKTIKTLDAMSPELLAQAEEISNQKLQTGGSARELAAIGRLTMLTQRLSHSATEFLTSGGVRSETAFLLGQDSTSFRTIVDGFLNGSTSLQLAAVKEPDMHEKFVKLNESFGKYQKLVASILANLPKFTTSKAAEQSIFYENEEVKKALTTLQTAYRNEQDTADIWFWMMVTCATLALITAVSVARVMLQDSRNRTRGAEVRRHEAETQRLKAQSKEEEAKATNDQNQAAILRLMNELQEVADGDLTVQATVSEDITGAIADSVNYTVEELRGLVGRVTATAEQVTKASSHAQNISNDLLTASEQQSREIEEASTTVLKMAGEITDVSRSASESADVARQSVAAALQGSTAVENAIKGMHEIREQIQETSKRIKRLGESSQEIGEITELISDITEQTNVLALNAAIQAASAGEAGRGFSVVAEEVQRLAERSAGAAKQIGALVRTIQTDTHDAVAAMEKSTQGVVEGARLSDAAGAALSDISRVSNRLAELIQGISLATELQATSANGVALNIQHILSVTEHTQDGTEQTANSIRQLTMLAQELKNSVSRFRVVA